MGVPGHRRAAAVILLAAFAVLQAGEAAGAHPCPHHDGVPAASAEHPAASAGHDAGHPHARAVASAHGAPVAADPAASHGACTCVGVCQLGNGLASPAPAPATMVPAESAAPEAAPAPTALPRDVTRLLPFAHAPPVIG